MCGHPLHLTRCIHIKRRCHNLITSRPYHACNTPPFYGICNFQPILLSRQNNCICECDKFSMSSISNHITWNVNNLCGINHMDVIFGLGGHSHILKNCVKTNVRFTLRLQPKFLNTFTCNKTQIYIELRGINNLGCL